MLLAVTVSAISRSDTPILPQSKCRTIVADRPKKKKEAFQRQLEGRPLKSLLRFLSACLSGLSLETLERLVSEKGCKWRSGVTTPPHSLIRRCWCSVAFPNSCLLCMFSFLRADGLRRVFPRRCNDIQIGRVICQVHFALGLTPGRSAHCVSRGAEEKKKRKALHVGCIRRAISSRLQRVED